MSYRDDVDTLYQRALVLQRELDTAQQRLADREARLAQLEGRPRPRAETSPGIRELRGMPDPHEVLDRLIENSEMRGSAHLPPLPMPDWDLIVGTTTKPEPPRPTTMVELVRERVALLLPEDLLLVAKIIQELTDDDVDDEPLRTRLRWLASELALQR